jgi:hypothetical protein
MRAILREGFGIHRREGSDDLFALTVGWRRLFELSLQQAAIGVHPELAVPGALIGH